jgi:SOS response regulatory protein OraA/RecX
LGGVLVTVIFIKDARSKGYLRLGVDAGGEKCDFTVSDREYREAGSPLVRDNLTRDSFDILYSADIRYRARMKALNILAYGDNSDKSLKRKLLTKGFRADVVDEVVSEMISLGYINTERQITKLVLGEVNLHHFGPMKIIPKLVLKGYSKSDVTRIISELEAVGEIDFEEAKARLIESKLDKNADETEKKKLLYKNGYYVC